MIVRAALLAVALLAAVAAAGATQLRSGVEIPLGSFEPGLALPAAMRPAMATDGDEVLVVYSGPLASAQSLYALRFDRSGRLLTPQPLVLVEGFEGSSVKPYGEPRVVWFERHYVVFFAGTDGNFHLLRLTGAGEVVARSVVPEWRLSSSSFDVATDGREIVLVNAGTPLLRIGSDLQVAGTIALGTGAGKTPHRSIAFGGGRFAIVTAGADFVTTQFLAGGVLTPEVRVGQANGEEDGMSRVVWTGAAFVTAWSDCTRDRCDVFWCALTPRGEAAGPPHAIDHVRDDGWTSTDSALTLTALDEETVFLTWESAQDSRTRGRRLRVSGAAVGSAIAVGTTPVATFRTNHGSLAVVDGQLRMALFDAPAVASLADPLPLASAILTIPQEYLLAAAASATELATVRRSSRGPGYNSGVIGVSSFDGRTLREIPINVVDAEIATDGRDFFALFEDQNGVVWFRRESAAAPVRFSGAEGTYGHVPKLVWTGASLLATWSEAGGTRIVPLDRDGNQLEPDAELLRGGWVLKLIARQGRILCVAVTEYRPRLIQLDARGRTVGPEVVLPFYATEMALATDGVTDAYVGVPEYDIRDLAAAFRPADGAFVRAPGRPHPPEHRFPSYPAAAVTPAGFVVAYSAWAIGSYVTLVDRQGYPVESVFLAKRATRRIVLLERSPDMLLAVYDRSAPEVPYAGVTRVFARFIASGEHKETDRERPLPPARRD
jgi:hypothetical protein